MSIIIISWVVPIGSHHWTIPFEIHTPPMEDITLIVHTGNVDFKWTRLHWWPYTILIDTLQQCLSSGSVQISIGRALISDSNQEFIIHNCMMWFCGFTLLIKWNKCIVTKNGHKNWRQSVHSATNCYNVPLLSHCLCVC